MLPIFTFKYIYLLKPNANLIKTIFLLCSIVAHTQTANEELEQKMRALYEKAHQLYAELPYRDYRGHYFTLAVGISPYGHIKTWRTENVCDCEGNVIDTKDVQSLKFPVAWTLGWEYHMFRSFSFRLAGSYAHLSHGSGKNVIAENSVFTQMHENYKLKQYSLQGSILWYLKDFYTGLGYSRTVSNASGFLTKLKTLEPTPQYFKLKGNILTPQRTDFTPQIFIGYRMMLSPNAFGSIEIGIAKNPYFNFQVNMPLSKSIYKSLKKWKEEFVIYEKVKRQALAIDRQLHPQKFQSNDCIDNSSIFNSSNSCPR